MSFFASSPYSSIFGETARNVSQGWSVAGFLFIFVFFLAVFGYLVGSYLADVIKAKVMLGGSVVYWTAALLNWLYVYLLSYYQQRLYVSDVPSVSWGLLWSMIPVLCVDITYVIKYFVKKRRTQS